MVYHLYRPVNSICGFTQEALNAMAANIEGREFLCQHNLPPEHPHACSTDDVECFFSVMQDTLGSDFALKRVTRMEAPLHRVFEELTHIFLFIIIHKLMEDSMKPFIPVSVFPPNILAKLRDQGSVKC